MDVCEFFFPLQLILSYRILNRMAGLQLTPHAVSTWMSDGSDNVSRPVVQVRLQTKEFVGPCDIALIFFLLWSGPLNKTLARSWRGGSSS